MSAELGLGLLAVGVLLCLAAYALGWRRIRKHAPTPKSGVDMPNALGRLRTRLDVSREEVAKRLAIPLAGVSQIERTPLRLLEVDTVQQYAEALGCRLDVVAVHIDGEAIWLSDERGAS
jgi:hypothetical protein